MRYGAYPQQWAHWRLWLGCGPEMLPVVCNPNAKISPLSQLKSVGKVPSRYDANRQVVGIAKWTTFNVTDALLDHWSQDEDLGFCLRSRSFAAIDVDIGSVEHAGLVRQIVHRVLGVLPARGRPGSSRVAFLLRVEPGGLKKRVITLARPIDGNDGSPGAIELLGVGQQLVVAGCHPSGGRYFWEGAEPDDIPTVSLEQLDECWLALDREFGDGSWRPEDTARVHPHTESEAPSPAAAGRRGLNGHDFCLGDSTSTAAADPIAQWLNRRGWVVGRGEGKLWVACPWGDQHTVDTSDSSSCWFLAGTGGYEQGHFECLHAHCARRTDNDFLEAVGYEQSFTEDFTQITDDSRLRARADRGAGGVDALPGGLGGSLGLVAAAGGLDDRGCPLVWSTAGPGAGLTKNKKGRWEGTALNLGRALATAGWWRRIQWDDFRQELFWSCWSGPDAGVLVAWRSDDFFKAREALDAAGFESVGKELLRDAIYRVGRADAFDSAQQWLCGLQWDGVPRVGRFLETYFGSEVSEYSRAVSWYLWTALAGRVLEPGCKADMVPILQTDRQGTGKSSSIEALAPHRDFYTTLDLAERDDALSRRLRGVLVAELVELRGLRSREHESIKAWVSQRADRWVPKYEELAVTVQRRFLMIGTTNESDFLSDTTGNRRWLPIRVKVADPVPLERDRDQLWAEAAASFLLSGIAWQQAEKLAPEAHLEFEEEVIGAEQVEAWIIENSICSATAEEILRQGLGVDSRNLRVDGKRIAKIMRKLGWQQKVTKDENRKCVRKWFLST